ncbi:unnamed protein product [Rodentolepis nana]|uniref:BZIP domain-containing protein n=1 Tax=Rodentolepis nana TaxID=102285 RepID=A0A0R3TLP5_RODNA|nr:unnamed protein product [Rodentolepis nana]
MALTYPTDEELVQMTTVQLRNLLDQNIITPDQHQELRVRRRRLQNRKYARRCAKKKQNEVANLEAETQAEWERIQSLKLQLSRLTVSSNRLDDHLAKLSSLKARMGDPNFSIPMVSSNGARLGSARLNPNLTKAQFESGMVSHSSSRSPSPSGDGDDLSRADDYYVDCVHRGRQRGCRCDASTSSAVVAMPSVGFRSSELCDIKFFTNASAPMGERGS